MTDTSPTPDTPRCSSRAPLENTCCTCPVSVNCRLLHNAVKEYKGNFKEFLNRLACHRCSPGLGHRRCSWPMTRAMQGQYPPGLSLPPPPTPQPATPPLSPLFPGRPWGGANRSATTGDPADQSQGQVVLPTMLIEIYLGCASLALDPTQ